MTIPKILESSINYRLNDTRIKCKWNIQGPHLRASYVAVSGSCFSFSVCGFLFVEGEFLKKFRNHTKIEHEVDAWLKDLFLDFYKVVKKRLIYIGMVEKSTEWVFFGELFFETNEVVRNQNKKSRRHGESTQCAGL